MFFLRVSTPEDTQEFAQQNDEMIEECIKAQMMINTKKGDERHPHELEEKFMQPFKQGGLGLVKTESIRHIAYLASWIQTAKNRKVVPNNSTLMAREPSQRQQRPT